MAVNWKKEMQNTRDWEEGRVVITIDFDSKKLSPIMEIDFDNYYCISKEELAEYHMLVEKLNGMLDGAPVTPKK